jgi:hypothetical protein
MALTATQRAFLANRLRIPAHPKATKSTSSGDREDTQLGATLDSFLEQEKALLAQLRQLGAWGFADAQRNLFEGQVAAIRQPVMGTDRSAGAQLLANAEQALKQLVGPLNTAIEGARSVDQPRKDARSALKDARPKMADADVAFVEGQWLEQADRLAANGKWAQAVTVLQRVVPHCTLAKKADLKSSTYGNQLDVLDKLVKHPQHAAFGTEIEHLGRIVSTIKTNVGLNVTNTLDYDVRLLGWYGTKYLDFADAHAVFVKERDRLALLLEGLRQSPLTAANPALGEDLKGVDESLERGKKQADKRMYEAATAALASAAKQLAEADKLKTGQQAWTDELQRVTPLLAKLEREAPALGTAVDTPIALELTEIQHRMSRAREMAGEGRDVKAATTWLTEIAADVQRVQKMVESARADVGSAGEALKTLDGDPAKALEATRRLFEALKLRPGHQGITGKLDEIERKLTEAADALKD